MAIATKAQLRTYYLERREKLEAPIRSRDSGFIRHRLLQLPAWQEADTILMYVSFTPEVDTQKIIEEALRQNKRVVVPLVVPERGDTPLSELRSLGDLAPGPLRGILQPAPAFQSIVDPSEIELALVPGIVFDRGGGRLGLGGGYFDRLMPKMTEALRIGLAFSIQIHSDPLPTEPHDELVDAIVTEKEFIEISNPGQHRGVGGV